MWTRFLLLTGLVCVGCASNDFDSGDSAFVAGRDVLLRVANRDVVVMPQGSNSYSGFVNSFNWAATASLDINPGSATLAAGSSYVVEAVVEPFRLTSANQNEIAYLILLSPARTAPGFGDPNARTVLQTDEGNALWSDVAFAPSPEGGVTISARNSIISTLGEVPVPYSNTNLQLARRPQLVRSVNNIIQIVAVPRAPEFWACLRAQCVLTGLQKTIELKPQMHAGADLP